MRASEKLSISFNFLSRNLIQLEAPQEVFLDNVLPASEMCDNSGAEFAHNKSPMLHPHTVIQLREKPTARV
jgi:hypothetical protein